MFRIVRGQWGDDALGGPEGDDGASDAGSGAGGTVTRQDQSGENAGAGQSSGGTQKPPVPQERVDKLLGTARIEGRESGRKQAEADLLSRYNVPDMASLDRLLQQAQSTKPADKETPKEPDTTNEVLEQIRRQGETIAELQRQLGARNALELEQRRSGAIEKELKALDILENDLEDALDRVKSKMKSDYEGLLDAGGNLDPAKAKAIADSVKKAKPNWFKRLGPGTMSHDVGEVQPPDENAKKTAAQQLANQIRSRL
jgi:hypothetical protein